MAVPVDRISEKTGSPYSKTSDDGVSKAANSRPTPTSPQLPIYPAGSKRRVDDRCPTIPYKQCSHHYKQTAWERQCHDWWFLQLSRQLPHHNWQVQYWCVEAVVTVHEVAFVPPSPAFLSPPISLHADFIQHSWLITIANRRTTKLSSGIATLEDGPIALTELPFRLRVGIHGSRATASQFAERKELCDMSGVTSEFHEKFGNTSVETPRPLNASANREAKVIKRLICNSVSRQGWRIF